MFELRKCAFVLACSVALYSLTQALAQHPKASNEAGLQRQPAETDQTATTHLRRASDAYWQVTLSGAPLKATEFGQADELDKILDQIEADPKVKVISIKSAVRGGPIKPLENSTDMDPAQENREMAALPQVEGGASPAPGEGTVASLPRLIGPDREVGADFNENLAARYGRVNPPDDEELDGVLDALARRITLSDQPRPRGDGKNVCRSTVKSRN
ncbi:hypothetical protein [Bradyrhizobium sp. USDA 3256]